MAEKKKKASKKQQPDARGVIGRRDLIGWGVTLAAGAGGGAIGNLLKSPTTIMVVASTSGAIAEVFSDLKAAYGDQCPPPLETLVKPPEMRSTRETRPEEFWGP